MALTAVPLLVLRIPRPSCLTASCLFQTLGTGLPEQESFHNLKAFIHGIGSPTRKPTATLMMEVAVLVILSLPLSLHHHPQTFAGVSANMVHAITWK